MLCKKMRGWSLRKAARARCSPYYWLIRANNGGETLVSSETYASRQDCTNAISLVKRGAGGGAVADRTKAREF